MLGESENGQVQYAKEPALSAAEFQGLLQRSSLAERRPATDLPRLERMLRGSNLVITARERNSAALVGISRCVTDFAYCCYCSDLAVDEAHQRQGIGKALLEWTQRLAGDECTLILVSAPKAIEYYPRLGMRRVEACFAWDRKR